MNTATYIARIEFHECGWSSRWLVCTGMTVAKIRRTAEKRYGVPAEEVIEMAYENVLADAATAIRGMRRPVVRCARPDEPPKLC